MDEAARKDFAAAYRALPFRDRMLLESSVHPSATNAAPAGPEEILALYLAAHRVRLEEEKRKSRRPIALPEPRLEPSEDEEPARAVPAAEPHFPAMGLMTTLGGIVVFLVLLMRARG